MAAAKTSKRKVQSGVEITKKAKALCDQMLKDLEQANRPVLSAVKCSLDNSFYNPKVGYLTPGDKMVRSELNVSSVQKLARTVFLMDILSVSYTHLTLPTTPYV